MCEVLEIVNRVSHTSVLYMIKLHAFLYFFIDILLNRTYAHRAFVCAVSLYRCLTQIVLGLKDVCIVSNLQYVYLGILI